jgi:hypothetical protein
MLSMGSRWDFMTSILAMDVVCVISSFGNRIEITSNKVSQPNNLHSLYFASCCDQACNRSPEPSTLRKPEFDLSAVVHQFSKPTIISLGQKSFPGSMQSIMQSFEAGQFRDARAHNLRFKVRRDSNSNTNCLRMVITWPRFSEYQRNVRFCLNHMTFIESQLIWLHYILFKRALPISNRFRNLSLDIVCEMIVDILFDLDMVNNQKNNGPTSCSFESGI